MIEKLIDDIYEAAVVVDRWPRVLEGLTRLGNGAGASFISGDERAMRWVATPRIDAVIAAYHRQPHVNSRFGVALTRRAPCFQTDLDLFTPAQLDADPFFTEFLRPQDLGWCIGTAIFAPGTDPIVFAVERAFSEGPPDTATLGLFDRLRPHLARATLLSVRLGLERARARTEALAAVGYPAAVLNPRGQLVAANGLMQALVPGVAEDWRERLVLTDPNADRLLAQALAALPYAQGETSVRSIPLRRRDDWPGAIAHLVPMRGLAHDIFAAAAALLLVTPLGGATSPNASLLEALYDLTPAEARVAQAVGDAKSIDAIALSLGTSKETVRAQLKKVFAKTGVSRQTELVQLLSGPSRIG